MLSRTLWCDQRAVHEDRVRYCTSDPRDRTEHGGGRGLDWFQGKRILLWTRKPGMGDMAMNAMCCDILRRVHGLDVWFGCRHNPYDREFPSFLDGVPCFTYQPDLHAHPLPKDRSAPRGYEGGIDHAGNEVPFDFVLDFRYHIHARANTLFQCLREFGVKRLSVPYDGLPVRNLPGIGRPHDVVLSLHCGGWKPLRAYRHGAELARRLRAEGLAVLDVAERLADRSFRLRDLLAETRCARLFIGVESGAAHLVSGVHRQAIILQAGIHRSAFWNVYARTHVIEADWPCGGRACQARKHEQCGQKEGVCIDRYAPEDVARLALELLAKER